MASTPNGPKSFPAIINRLLFNEPQGGLHNWIFFLMVTANNLFWLIFQTDFVMKFGIVFYPFILLVWLESLAEILPKGQWKLAGAFRILGWIIFFGGTIYFSIAFIVTR